jgi:hypothetical protein
MRLLKRRAGEIAKGKDTQLVLGGLIGAAVRANACSQGSG